MASERISVKKGCLEEIFKLFSNGRILKAYEEYEQLSKAGQCQTGEEDKLFQQYSAQVKLLMDRYLDVMKCLSSNEGLDWTVGRELGGLTAFYQVQPDGSISACVHGRQEEVPVFEQAVVISDIERLCAWVPLFTQSDLITLPGKLEAIFQGTMSTPFLSRDAVLHMWGADCLTEHQTYLCIGKSVKTFAGANIPSVNRTLFHDRAHVNNFSVRIKVLNPSTVEIHVLLNIHLNASLPHWLISFLVNNLLSIVMSVLKQQATKMVTEKDTFEGALRGKAFPLVTEHFLPRAQEIWRSNNWLSLTPSSSLDSQGAYLPPFLRLSVSHSSPSPSRLLALPQQRPSGRSHRKTQHYGLLWKLGHGLLVNPWAQRFFVLDYRKHTLTYYAFHSSLLSLATFSSSPSASSSPSSSAISSSLASVLLNDPQKIKRGEIHLENKKILFYLNDKHSINWFNSSGTGTGVGEMAMASSTGSSFVGGSTSTAAAAGGGTGAAGEESWVIEIVYLKSEIDSKRSNMILLSYNSQIAREWAEALTFVTASATKFHRGGGGRETKGKSSSSSAAALSLDYNELRDEMRDSLASFHGLLPSPTDSTSPSSPSSGSGLKKRIRGGAGGQTSSSVTEGTDPESGTASASEGSVMSKLLSSLVKLDPLSLPSLLIELLIDLFDAVLLSPLVNLSKDLIAHGNILPLIPLLVPLLCPLKYQTPLLLLLIYALLYSDKDFRPNPPSRHNHINSTHTRGKHSNSRPTDRKAR